DGIELNLSCPHVSGTGVEIGADLDLVSDVVKAVGDVTSVPIFAKISALYPRVPELGAVVERSGADGITAINTLRAMVIDTTVRRPILAGIYGGLSGPAIRPVAVRCVYELYESVDIPIIGVGGITGWEDAVEFVLAGATAVQIGTAVGRRGLRVFKDVTEGLRRYLADGGFKSIKDVIGLAHGE
ncbi:TPA: dihydroorotate dehydrogenase, partial [Candidatus Bathyarchaeota archaeon]|nr:dihydroorotate dehydrogenase [Candidatus Bathyarchaeota archaeon]